MLRSTGLVRAEAVLFNFRTRFISDEKQEDIYPVLIDAPTAQAVNYQLPWLQAVFFAATEPQLDSLAPAEHCGYATAYTAAKQALPQVFAPDLEQFQARMQRFLQEEAARLASFYRATLNETRQRLQRLGADDARRERLEKSYGRPGPTIRRG